MSIECKICNKKFESQITNSHLKTHNITTHEYKSNYGELSTEKYRNNLSIKAKNNPNMKNNFSYENFGDKCSCVICKKPYLSFIIARHHELCLDKKRKHDEEYSNLVYLEDYVICPICDMKLKEINNDHLRKHNINKFDFDKLYPNSQRSSIKTKNKKATLVNMSEETSKKLKKSHTLEGYIEKYGEEIGLNKYDERKEKSWWSKTLEGYIEKYGELEGVDRYEQYCSSHKEAMTVEGFIKRYGDENGLIQYENYKNKLKKSHTLEGYIEKYGEEIGKSKWFNKNKKNSASSRYIDYEYISDYEKYKNSVKFFTEMNKHYLDNLDQRSRTKHIDHKISKAYGFKNNIPPYIIGSHYNLEIIDANENCSKGAKCSIDINDLFDMIFKNKGSNK